MAIPISRKQFEEKFGRSVSEQSKPKKQGFFSEVKERVQKAGSTIDDQIRGRGEFAGQSVLRRATGAVATGFSTPLGVAKDALPEFAEKGLEKAGTGVSKGLNWAVNNAGKNPFGGNTKALVDTPQFQKFANSSAGSKLENIAGIGGNIGEIAGNILTYQGAANVTNKTAQTVVNKTAQVTRPALQKTGRILKKAGEQAYKVTVTPEESTRNAMQAYQAKQGSFANRAKQAVSGKELPDKPITEANTAARHGLAGTEWRLGVQAKQKASDLWTKTIQPKLEQVQGSVNMKKFFAEVEKEIRKGTKELSRRNAKLEALEALKEDFKSVGNVKLPKLQGYKEGWAERVPEATYKGKPIGSALNDVKNIAAEKARQIIYKHAGPEAQQAYIDYGNLQSIMKSGVKSIADPAKRSISRNIWEGIMDQAITPVATYAGKVLYRTGEGLEFWGNKGGTKVSDILSKDITPAAVLKAEQFVKNEASEFVKNPKVGMSIESPKRPQTMKAKNLVSHEGAPDLDQVNMYRSQINRGEGVQPIKIIKEGNKWGIEDGKHRFAALQMEGIEDIPVQIIERVLKKLKINNYQERAFYTKASDGRFTGSSRK